MSENLLLTGLDASWDGKKYCTNLVCRMGPGDTFCTHECIPRGWTHGECRHLPPSNSVAGFVDTGYCCCWTP